MGKQSYEEERANIENDFMEAEEKTFEAYIQLIREYLPDMIPSQRTAVMGTLEKLTKTISSLDPKNVGYERGLFDPEAADDILKRNGKNWKTLAEEIRCVPSTISRYLKEPELFSKNCKGIRKKTLIYLAEKGYDPFNILED